MQCLGWCVALALSVVVGYAAGNAQGKDAGRSEIANECRQAGAFAYKRTGFDCGVKK